jgi:phosphoglycolate phosphatase/AHBA synthesis associated protein
MLARPVRAIVFDLDGTLIDSVPTVLSCYARAVREFGGPDLSADQVLAAFSIGPARVMLETLIGRPVGAEAVASYEAHLARRVADIAPYPGVVDAVRTLSAHVALGVFTAADTSAAEILLEAAGLRGHLGPVVGSDRVARPKPAPDGLVAVLDVLGVEPADAAYVGDGPADTPVARSCGALAVAAAWGHLYEDGRDADVTVRAPSELHGLIGAQADAMET